MTSRISRVGIYEQRNIGGETVRSYVPHPLPPKPSIEFSPQLEELLEKANIALGRLDGLAALLPDISLFIYVYVRKEALLSSQIEGTQSSLSDLLLFESEHMPGVPLDDVQEVSRYVAAMTHGLKRLREGFPLSLRLIREIHSVLMTGARGSEKSPGEFRRSQNWLGGTRPGNAVFVPAPAEKVLDLMSDLERFWHDQPARTPTLVKAALAHVQFETIHPFLDGNGRLGRLLITLLLCTENVLIEPTLYLSLFFKTHRAQYYALLQKVRLEGAWEEWLEFFLEGVLETATQAIQATKAILACFSDDQNRIQALTRASSSTFRIHQYVQKRVYLSVGLATRDLGLSAPTVLKAIAQLEKLDVLREMTGKQRDRIWVYQKYFDILNESTEPIQREQ
jgi:Fic family protein